MRSYLYLSTAVAGVVMTAGAGASYAQCVTTQNCAELGYTETSCPDGTGLKCPFGDTFACTGGSCANDCDKLGFKYTCTGTGYTGGAGSVCGGKYTQCSCASGYEWSGSACVKEACSSSYKYICSGTGYAGGSGTACDGKYAQCSCAIGYEGKNGSCQFVQPCLNKADGAYDEYYCCSEKVVGVRALGMYFFVSLFDLGMIDRDNASTMAMNYSFCGRTKGDMPQRDVLLLIYRNKFKIDLLLSQNGGKEIASDWYWASDSNNYGRYIVNMSNGQFDTVPSYGTYLVRPVLYD